MLEANPLSYNGIHVHCTCMSQTFHRLDHILMHFKFPCKNKIMEAPRVQRKSVLQLAIRASCGQHLQAKIHFNQPQKLFNKQDCLHNSSVILNSSKNITCPLGKLRAEFISPIAKSTSPMGYQTLLSLHTGSTPCE